jgi:hypothetical protein
MGRFTPERPFDFDEPMKSDMIIIFNCPFCGAEIKGAKQKSN